jgi:DNA-directed RNA polymerase alpha subunit
MDNINKATPEIDLPKIGKPATRALTNAGYSNLAQLTKVTETEILKLHGVGPKAVRILNEALKEKGISFAKNS